MARGEGSGRGWPLLAGLLAGGVAAALLAPATRRRRLDRTLVRALSAGSEAPPVVFVPGILGSQLVRPDGTTAWLNLGNAFGHHDLRLSRRARSAEGHDDLRPGLLVGTDTVLPRAFGFTEYADVLDLLDGAGFEPGMAGSGLRYAVFTYDWRLDLVETARDLAHRLDALAEARGDPDARFHLVGHSMGGLVVRYYLRFGEAGPEGAEVTWAGARRVASALLVATPSAGSIQSLDAILEGTRVGLSYTTLAASVVSRMPSIYQLLPPDGTYSLLSPRGRRLRLALHDIGTWERFGWGPFAPSPDDRGAEERAFLRDALERARSFHTALARAPETPCPVPIYAIGGDCLPTLARAVVGEGKPGQPPRFEPRTRREQELMFQAGDGRVTRASLLGSHLPSAPESESGCGIPEVKDVFFGAADHHGLYGDPAFQSLLLRLLLRRGRPPVPPLPMPS